MNVRQFWQQEAAFIKDVSQILGEDDWGDEQVKSFEDFFSFKLVKSLDTYREPLMAFWILQHQRNIKPFRTVLTFKLKFTASYTKKAWKMNYT
jgi:hypothetical protein